jgi:DNA-directed RNA polymerase specialized sigma24 family protein
MPQFRQELAGVNGNHRGVLALRRFEGRGNVDVTEIPGIQKTAASNRRARALNSLEGLLEPFAVPGRQGRSIEDVNRLRTT